MIASTNKRGAAPPKLTASEREDYEERAAIIEYDAGTTRAEAERQALALVLGKRGTGRLL